MKYNHSIKKIIREIKTAEVQPQANFIVKSRAFAIAIPQLENVCFHEVGGAYLSFRRDSTLTRRCGSVYGMGVTTTVQSKRLVLALLLGSRAVGS